MNRIAISGLLVATSMVATAQQKAAKPKAETKEAKIARALSAYVLVAFQSRACSPERPSGRGCFFVRFWSSRLGGFQSLFLQWPEAGCYS